jgi:hypothetical protein
MHRARLEARVGDVIDRGWVALRHYEHAFRKLGADGTAKGTIVAAREQIVHGVLYEIDDRQLGALTRWEGGYRRVEVDVDGAAAITFEALRLVDGLEPAHDYIEHYLAGMVEHGLPDDYIEIIRRQSGR